MKYLRSLILLIDIHFQRLLDHSWRLITGAPTVKRSMITPHIYLGGQYYHLGLKKLRQLGITAIVNMRTSPIPQSVDKNYFDTLHIPTPDLHAPPLEKLKEGISFIHKQISHGGKVYIHCRLGEGRGPTMTIAYLMSAGLTYEDAYKAVKTVRTFIQLTPHQVSVLKQLEKEIKATE